MALVAVILEFAGGDLARRFGDGAFAFVDHAGVRIAGGFPLFLALAVGIVVDVRHGMDTVHHLNLAQADARGPGLAHDLIIETLEDTAGEF